MGPGATHPGEHLADQLTEHGLTASVLRRKINVPTSRITGFLNGQRVIAGDSALRLAHFFGTKPDFWLSLQGLYELRLAEAKAGAAIRHLSQLRESEKCEPRRSQSRTA